jgi:predicted transcriptional regulator
LRDPQYWIGANPELAAHEHYPIVLDKPPPLVARLRLRILARKKVGTDSVHFSRPTDVFIWKCSEHGIYCLDYLRGWAERGPFCPSCLAQFPRDHTAVMVSILQSINDRLDRSVFAASLDSERFDKYLQMMSRRGLVRRAEATSEGEQYEVTETGLHFLKEYGDIERDLTRAPLNPCQKTPSRSG